MKVGLFVLTCFLCVSGCSTMSGIPERSINVEKELESLKDYFLPTIISIYNSKSTDSEKKSYRDEVVFARLRAIDLNYNNFISDISVESKELSIGADSAVLLLGAAGAVSTVSSTQAILSASTATVTGIKSSIDKNAYYDSTLTALVSQMQASRKEVLVAIYLGMELGVNEYSLMRALIDVESYFQAGTIIGSVNEINKSSGAKNSKADEEISNIVKAKYHKDKSGDAIRAYWKPDGKTINKNNANKLKSWMKKNGLDKVSISLFVRSINYTEFRKKAVKEIPIP